MKRKVIKIDESKCTGCGACIPNCPEGALQIIDGKARLVGELLCDGLGACVGKCPEGAMSLEERDVEDYDENKVMANVVKAGPATIAVHLKHLKDHGQNDYYQQAIAYLKEHKIEVPSEDLTKPLPCGCPGSMMKDFRSEQTETTVDGPRGPSVSQLGQWPIQLHLLNPKAPYFMNADLVIAADCVPFAFADFHQRFLKGKALVIFCPKLDSGLEAYIEKLAKILKENEIKSLTIIHMEVPCCFGTVKLAEEALKRSGKNIIVKDYTISLRGEII